jgi:20S proteasome alpha/beta subunit
LTAWKSTAIGKNADKVMEILETNFEDDMNYSKALNLVVDCMLQYVEAGSKNIEIAVMKDDQLMNILNDEEVDKIIAEIEEKKKKDEKK